MKAALPAWFVFAAGPLAFLVLFGGLSIFFSVRGATPDEVSGRVTEFLPHVLLGVQIILALIALSLARSGVLRFGTVRAADAFIGVLCGGVLAFAYIYGLAPGLRWLQTNAGDYVPPGEILPVLAGSIGIFFTANVLLAPFTEEVIYRAFALPFLGETWGATPAILASCLLFGLLHWAGGFWYMLLTGFIAGGLFAGLYLWRDGLAAPLTAHLTLNLIEFVYAYLKLK